MDLTNEVVDDVDSPESGGEKKKDSGEGEDQAYRNLCSHYSRGCSLVAPCCGKVYPCRLCHNEQDFTHDIDRYAVSEVVCRRCSTKQPVSDHCSSCNLSFALYFCPVCRLYDDVDKQQFHCEKCGLCRIGGRENLYHCDKCGLCLPMAIKENHPCRQGSSKNNCPVCMDDLHASREPPIIPTCGHLIHRNCFQDMMKNGLYQCPLCYISMVDMSNKWEQMDEERDAWQMPFHLRNFLVKILCRDCHQESTTGFHIIGLKCEHCSSYNTVRCGNEEVPEDAEMALEDVRMQMIWEMIHQMVQARQRERMPALLQRFRERRAAREAEREAAEREGLGGGEGGEQEGGQREGGGEEGGEEGGEGGGEEGQGRGGQRDENDFQVVPVPGWTDQVVPQLVPQPEIGPPLDFGPVPPVEIDRHSDSEHQSDLEEDSGDGSDSADQRGPPAVEPDNGSDMSQSDPPESDGGSDNQGDDDEDSELNYLPPLDGLLSHAPLSSDESSESDSDASWVTEEEEVVIGGGTDSSEDEEDAGPVHSNMAATTASKECGTLNQNSNGVVGPRDNGGEVSSESQEWETASEEMAVDGDV